MIEFKENLYHVFLISEVRLYFLVTCGPTTAGRKWVAAIPGCRPSFVKVTPILCMINDHSLNWRIRPMIRNYVLVDPATWLLRRQPWCQRLPLQGRDQHQPEHPRKGEQASANLNFFLFVVSKGDSNDWLIRWKLTAGPLMAAITGTGRLRITKNFL